MKTNPYGKSSQHIGKQANQYRGKGRKRGQLNGINRPFIYVASFIIVATVLIASYQLIIHASGEEPTTTTNTTASVAEIVEPGMSDLEIISEIFYWITDHINYKGTSYKSDWVSGAYLGITRGTGDCFNFFAAAKAFLTRAGYETIPIERVQDANTRHYWNLVEYNNAWYHFDPLPNLAKYHYVCLLRTDAEVAEYSIENPLFYEFDHAGIPATPTEALDIERKIIHD